MLTLKTTAKVTAVKRRTRSAGIKGAEVGDVFEFTCPIESPGSGTHGTYATYIKLKNLRTDKESWFSFNQMSNVLDTFDFEEIKEANENNTICEVEEIMNISIVNQDLFTVPQGYYLAHCISSDFALGAGIAKQFDKVYNMRAKLSRDYPQYSFMGGTALIEDNVFNLVTKEKYWHKPTYDTLRDSLETMRALMEGQGITKLAMPKIGCGLDRLEWDKVYEIIEDVFKDMDVEILICSLD